MTDFDAHAEWHPTAIAKQWGQDAYPDDSDSAMLFALDLERLLQRAYEAGQRTGEAEGRRQAIQEAKEAADQYYYFSNRRVFNPQASWSAFSAWLNRTLAARPEPE